MGGGQLLVVQAGLAEFLIVGPVEARGVYKIANSFANLARHCLYV
jgi:hypothetical protein